MKKVSFVVPVFNNKRISGILQAHYESNGAFSL